MSEAIEVAEPDQVKNTFQVLTDAITEIKQAELLSIILFLESLNSLSKLRIVFDYYPFAFSNEYLKYNKKTDLL